MEQREGQAVQRLDQRQRNDLSGRAQNGPAHNPRTGGQHRGVCRTEPVEKRRPDHKKYDDLRYHLLRPQQARSSGADPGIAPSYHRKGIVQRVTAEHERANQQQPAKRADVQEREEPAGRFRTKGDGSHGYVCHR